MFKNTSQVFFHITFIMNSNGAGFYITLPSDSSKDLFPENNPSEYVTKLPRWVQLSGEWEVGLHSIAYKQWNIVQHLDEPILYTVIQQGQTVKHEAVMIKKYYTTVHEYISSINESLKKSLEKESLPADDIKFGITNGKVTITLRSGYKVYLRREQAIVLGFMKFGDSEEVKTFTGTELANYVANLHRETNIHVYNDIIQPQIVGDRTISLLAIIPTKKTTGTYETVYAAENIHYIPIQRKSFQKIKVFLRSSTEESIPFEHGRASITLHLKPVNYF